MANYIKYGVIVAIIGAIYLIGYKHAETKGELAMESLKHEHAQAIIEAQKKVQKDYEKRIESLVADLDGLRVERDRRMHELQNFRQSRADLDACINQRNDLAELGVEGERLLNEARQYLKATVRQ